MNDREYNGIMKKKRKSLFIKLKKIDYYRYIGINAPLLIKTPNNTIIYEYRFTTIPAHSLVKCIE